MGGLFNLFSTITHIPGVLGSGCQIRCTRTSCAIRVNTATATCMLAPVLVQYEVNNCTKVFSLPAAASLVSECVKVLRRVEWWSKWVLAKCWVEQVSVSTQLERIVRSRPVESPDHQICAAPPTDKMWNARIFPRQISTAPNIEQTMWKFAELWNISLEGK